MQKLLNTIICGDCIEILGKIDGPFADLIFADKELLELFANQFTVRMNNHKRCSSKVVAPALKGLAG
jgi:DNA modification methylase